MLSPGVLLRLVGFSGLLAVDAQRAATPRVEWKILEPGIEYATVTPPPGPSDLPIDGRLHIVRIDPQKRRLEAVMSGGDDGKLRPAGAWCRERHLAVAINMGMYEKDERTNTGYARSPGYVNNGHWTKYRAALGFGPTKHGAPPVLMADLDNPADKARLADYGTVIQDLRLIRAGRSVWEKQDRAWSEAALGVDKQGRVLFIFSRTPHTMKDLNDILLALPLDLDTAMHAEGGPEASLSIHAGGVNIDLNGRYDGPGEGERLQWAIPNVIGVRSR